MSEEEMNEQEKPQKTTIILTYRTVTGFPDGIHGDGRLIVHSANDRHYEDFVRTDMEERAPGILHSLMHKIYNREGFDNVDMIYVYAGVNAMDQALHAASNLAGLSNVTLVACRCQKEKKERFAKDNGIEIIFSNCGAQDTLGDIANKILNGE